MRKTKWAPAAPSSFLHQDYSKYKKVQNRFSFSHVGCLRLICMVSASPTYNWETLERFSIEPFPLPQPPGRWWRSLSCCESRCGARRLGSSNGWVFGCPDKLKQHKNFNQFAQLQMLWVLLCITVSVHAAFTSHAASFMQSQVLLQEGDQSWKFHGIAYFAAPTFHHCHFKCWTGFCFWWH